MKFYDCATAPSPRRVRMFLAEKGVEVPVVHVDLRTQEQRGEAFRAINPDQTVPVLELDDGTRICDAIAICTYIEETWPEPALMGRTPKEKAIISAWQRQVERDGFYAGMDALRNSTPRMVNRALPGPFDYAQIPELAERGKLRLANFYRVMEERLAQSTYLAGEDFTIADISLLIAIDFAGWVKVGIPEDCLNLKRWYAVVSERPSAKL